MKKILFTLILIWCFVMNMQAQQFIVKTTDDMLPGKPCDKVRVKVSYLMRFVNDTTAAPVKPMEENMILEIGKKISQFYCYTTYVGDSVFAAGIEKGLSDSKLSEEMGKYGMGKISWRLYKNYNGMNTSTLLDAIGMERYRCEEKNEMPKWQLTADTMRVIGYLCNKATTTLKGRVWNAWYTSEIPINDGPWKLCGLPGLILKANDAKDYYSFKANGIVDGKAKDIMYKGDKYELISRKDLNKIYLRYYTDPVGYITSNPNVKMTLTDENGNKTSNPKNYPYNPIEK